MRVLRWLLISCAIVAVFSVARPLSSTAQEPTEDETAAQGTLTAEIDGERTPIEGVELTATLDGEEVGTATSDADGKWRIVLPAGGTYQITLDPETLPDDAGLREGESETRTFEVDTGRSGGVIFKLGERTTAGPNELEQAVNLAVDGLRLGLVIAMAAVGLSLIFGVTGLINFAHGELVTLGALVVWYLNSGDGLSMSFLLATVIAVGVGAAAGYVSEKGLFAPLRRRRTGNVALIVVTIGLGLALRNVYLIVFGGSAKPFRQYALQEPLEFGPIEITPRDLAIIVIGIIVMVGVALLLQRTRFGTAMRAVSDNADLAEASGIDTGRVILVTWVGGAALAALGGVMLGLSERVAVDMGERILLLMFAAVILGGLGRAYGALVGSIIIGLTVQLSTLWVSVEFKYVVAFGLLIVVLLVRPQGLLGRAGACRLMDIWAVVVESIRLGIGPQAAAYAVAAVGLNLHFGHTGLLNFGQVGFLLVGAYGTGITVDQGGSLWLGMLVGCLAAVVLALLLGIPTLRLRADYLAVVTITVSEILRYVVRSKAAQDLTGGVFGISQVVGDFVDLNPISPGQYGWGDLQFSHRSLWVMLVGWTLALLCTLVVRQLIRSPWGRVLRSIREDEDAVRSLGKNAFLYKLQSLVIGGVMGGLGGIVLLLLYESVTPDLYGTVVTFFIFTIVILGGAGSTWGPIVGSIVFWTFIEFSNGLLREAIDAGVIDESVLSPQEVAAVRFIVMGLMLAGLMIWRPQGLFGNRQEVLLDVD